MSKENTTTVYHKVVEKKAKLRAPWECLLTNDKTFETNS